MEVSPGNSYIARPTPPTEGMTEKEIKEARYPHTRPAPRIAPVVPIGSMPIPGHGPWSMVQTGALGRIPPLDKNLPEGKPGVLGEGESPPPHEPEQTGTAARTRRPELTLPRPSLSSSRPVLRNRGGRMEVGVDKHRFRSRISRPHHVSHSVRAH